MTDSGSGAPHGWRALGGVAPLLATATVARLHVGGVGLALLLLVEDDRASLASAGAAVAALSAGIGLTRPLQGRLLDRRGMRCLAALALLHALAAAALLLTAAAGAPPAGLIAASFLLGFSAPSISVAVRAAVVAEVPADARPAALGADTALQDGAFALGPLLAGLVAAIASPGAALVVLVVVGCAGAVAMALLFELPRAPRPPRPLAPPALRPIARPLTASTALGVVYGALAVGGVAAVLEHGGDALAGPATAAVFAGGICGDLLIAPRLARLPVAVRLRRRLLALLALSAALVAVPAGVPLVIALLIVGAALAAASVTVSVDVAARAAQAARAEAFGWAGAMLRLGNAIGAGAAGLLADGAGARAALLVAVAGAALAWMSAHSTAIKTGSVSALAAIGVARHLLPRLPEAHETPSHPHRPLRDLGRPAHAGRRDR